MTRTRLVTLIVVGTALCAVGAFYFVRYFPHSTSAAPAGPRSGIRAGPEITDAEEHNQLRRREDLESVLSRTFGLRVGDSREKIETVLRARGVPFEFNLLELRYETGAGVLPPKTQTWTVVADLKLDGSGRLKSIETRIVPLPP